MLRDELKLPFKNYNHPSVKRHDGKAGDFRKDQGLFWQRGAMKREKTWS